MPNYEALSSDRSEFQGEAGPQYLTPSRAARRLSVGERAALLRREAMHPGSPFGPSQRTAYDDATNPDRGSIQLTPGFRQN